MKLFKEGQTLKITSNVYVAPELLAAARQIAATVEVNENDEIFLSKGK